MNGANWFVEAFGAAVDDIRKKVVEEPWFDRAVTPPFRPERSMSDDLGWTRDGQRPDQNTPAHETDHGFER